MAAALAPESSGMVVWVVGASLCPPGGICDGTPPSPPHDWFLHEYVLPVAVILAVCCVIGVIVSVARANRDAGQSDAPQIRDREHPERIPKCAHGKRYDEHCGACEQDRTCRHGMKVHGEICPDCTARPHGARLSALLRTGEGSAWLGRRAQLQGSPSPPDGPWAVAVTLAVLALSGLAIGLAQGYSVHVAMPFAAVAAGLIAALPAWRGVRRYVGRQRDTLSADFMSTSMFTPLAEFGAAACGQPPAQEAAAGDAQAPSAADPDALVQVPAAYDGDEQEAAAELLGSGHQADLARFFMTYATALPASYAQLPSLPTPAGTLWSWNVRASRIALIGLWLGALTWLGALWLIVPKHVIYWWAVSAIVIVITGHAARRPLRSQRFELEERCWRALHPPLLRIPAPPLPQPYPRVDVDGLHLRFPTRPCSQCGGVGKITTTDYAYVQVGRPDPCTGSVETRMETYETSHTCQQCEGRGSFPRTRAEIESAVARVAQRRSEYDRLYDQIIRGVADRNLALAWREGQLRRWLANA